MRLRSILLIFSIIFIILLSLIIIKSKVISTTPLNNLLTIFQNKNSSPGTSDKNDTSFESILNKCFDELEVNPSQVHKNFNPKDSILTIKVSVPKGRPTEWVIWFIASKLSAAGLQLTDSQYESERKGATVHFSPQRADIPHLKVQIQRSSSYFSQTAKMAILVEDFGFEANETSVGFLSFSEPLTVSMVSSRRLSTWTAQIANEYKKEIVIMLPMEPLPAAFSRYDKSQIKLHYPEEKIKTIIREATDAIPSFAGFCNFYGSRVLQDSRVMQIIFSEVQNHHGYFIITESGKKSIAEQMAKKQNLPFQKLDFTINTENSASVIADSLRYCAIIAQNTGKVLVRGRPTASFITALQNTLAQLKQNGIRLVYVSEILDHPAER